MFRLGLGLAFNNCTEQVDHLVIADSVVVRVAVIRGPAVLLADNAAERIPLGSGDLLTVCKSGDGPAVLGLSVFRCPQCYQLRQDNQSPV
jgi:hypothetical protein